MAEDEQTEESLEEKLEDEIVVFDSLDTIQGYEGAKPGENKAYYLKKVAEKHGLTVDEMLEKVPAKTYLKWTADMIYSRELVPRILPGAEDLLLRYIKQGYRPVIITADIKEAAERTTQPIVDKGLVRKEDVYAILDVGSKKKPETWTEAKRIYKPSSKVVAVYEDTEKNLDAALKAFNVPGYLVKETSSGISYIKR